MNDLEFYSRVVPTSKTEVEDIKRREAFFRDHDMQGKGHLTIQEVKNNFKTLMKDNNENLNLGFVLDRAFIATKEYQQKKRANEIDSSFVKEKMREEKTQLDIKQFRLFLVQVQTQMDLCVINKKTLDENEEVGASDFVSIMTNAECLGLRMEKDHNKLYKDLRVEKDKLLFKDVCDYIIRLAYEMYED